MHSKSAEHVYLHLFVSLATRQMNECVVIVMALAFSLRHNESHNQFNVCCIFMQCFKWLVFWPFQT